MNDTNEIKLVEQNVVVKQQNELGNGVYKISSCVPANPLSDENTFLLEDKNYKTILTFNKDNILNIPKPEYYINFKTENNLLTFYRNSELGANRLFENLCDIFSTSSKKIMKHHDEQYKDLLVEISNLGNVKADRTGTGTKSIFGTRMEFDLTGNKIPLLTTKKIFYKGIIHELIWMLSGDTNIKYLKENNVSIWDSWADPKTGELNKIYQKQWRAWEDTRIIHESELFEHLKKGFTVFNVFENEDGKQYVIKRKIDQISNLIQQLKTNPDSRRLIVSAWNVADIEEMSLPPCHLLVQFYTRELSLNERLTINGNLPDGFIDIHKKYPQPSIEELSDIENNKNYVLKYGRGNSTYHEHINVEKEQHELLDTLGVPRRAISSQMYQRSVDTTRGNPFNIVQYALLTHMVAKCVNMVAEKFIWIGGDTHIYNGDEEGTEIQLSRESMDSCATIKLNPNINNIFDFKFEDVTIENYESHPAIKFPPVSV